MKFRNWKLQMAIITISTLMGLASCSSSTDPYKPYLGHHINYPQRVDTVFGYSGIKHVTLNIPKPSDPQVAKVGIFWHNQTDSMKADFQPDKDTLQVEIDSLLSGSYTFNVYTYTKEDVKSARSRNSTIKAYGEDFSTSLHSREVTYSIYYNNKLYVYWGGFGEESLVGEGSKLYYTNTSGVKKAVFIGSDNKLSVIDDYNAVANDSTIQYKTIYINSPSVADSFKTTKKPINVDIINPASDLIAEIVQYDDENPAPWKIFDNGVQQGQKTFLDRSFELQDITPYEGADYIRVANDSKVWSDTNIETDPLAKVILRNDVKGPITFYIGLDDRFDSLPWLINQNFKKTPNIITITVAAHDYQVWKREYQPGDVIYIGGLATNSTNNCLLFLEKAK